MRFFGKSVNTRKKMLHHPIFPAFCASAVGLTALMGCGGQPETDIAVPSVAAAENTATEGPPQGADPKKLVAAAIQTMENHRSVSAEIRHEEKSLLGRSFIGTGTYHEQRQAGLRQMRLHLSIPSGNEVSSLVHVCDGQYFWKHRNLLGDAKLSRIDLAKVHRALNANENLSNPERSGKLLGMGGLPGLLRGLQEAFDFTSAQPGQWGEEKLPVWKLSGRWKTEYLIRAMPGQKEALEKGAEADLSRLPELLPDRVILILGQDILFPYRIEYHRTDEGVDRKIATMSLHHIKIDAPIEPSRFLYNPGQTDFVDETAEFIESLKADGR